jgi:DNA mismatch repair protein MSH6
MRSHPHLFVAHSRSSSRASSRPADDDDYEVPEESETQRSRPSSRASSVPDDEDDDFIADDSDEEPKSKKTKKAPAAKKSGGGGGGASRPGLKRSGTGSKAETTGSGSFAFLTAAEQRMQEKKDDKKAGEDAFSFLQDVKDVRILYPHPSLSTEV